MKSISRNTAVISVSLSKEVADKLEKTRSLRGQSRSALITSLIEKEAEEEAWRQIYKKGREVAQELKITSEDDIDRILHAA